MHAVKFRNAVIQLSRLNSDTYSTCVWFSFLTSELHVLIYKTELVIFLRKILQEKREKTTFIRLEKRNTQSRSDGVDHTHF